MVSMGHGHGKRRWAGLSSRQRGGIVALGTSQIALHAYAWQDLIRRPAEQVNGPKLPWGLALLINWVGPIVYLTRGRRRD